MILFKLSEWTWDGVGPGILSLYHILWLVACFILCVYFGKKASCNKESKTVDKVILILDIILIISEFIKQYLYHFEYYGYFRIDVLPYSFCSVPMYFALIGSLTKKEILKDISYKFLSFYGIVGGICAMIYPVTLDTDLIFISIQTMLWHTILVIMSVYLIIAKGYGNNFKKEVFPAFIVFLACTLLAVGLNEVAYHAYLEPVQKPEITIDYDPGAYEYYKFGFFDQETNSYKYISLDDGVLSITNNHLDASNVVIEFHQDNSEDFVLLIEDENGTSKYLTVNEEKEITLTDESQTIFTFDYYEDKTIFVTKIDEKSYFMNKNLELSSNEEYKEHLSFIDLQIEHSGDYANFFFVSNHAETNIPGLDIIQKHAPYPVFVISYLLSVFVISSLVFYFVKFVRRIVNKKQTN